MLTNDNEEEIKDLTPEQIAAIPDFITENSKISLSTDPINPERAVAAIKKLYECGEKPYPRYIIFMRSPLECLLGALKFKELEEKDATNLVFHLFNEVVDTSDSIGENK